MSLFRHQPLFVILLALSSAALYLPMLYAIRIENWLEARVFFYHATVYLIVTCLIAFALQNRPIGNRSASRLIDLAAAFFILPIFMALPVNFLVPQVNFSLAYFEMLSSFTTTGASIFEKGSAVPDVVHLWRSTVGWLGGYMMLIVALAIFKQINLGGFEVYSSDREGLFVANRMKRADVRDRTINYAASIFPIYTMATLALAVILVLCGDRPLVALIHAMSTLSTSGISYDGGLAQGQSGILGEMAVFIFLFLAVSRLFFLRDRDSVQTFNLNRDKELNIALLCVVVIPLLLFSRHWLAAQEFATEQNWLDGLLSLWGGFFTVLSFLTTTGFESSEWSTARDWSGLPTSGLILMGLAVMGGGIATTAGGIKLLRIYALYKHGARELRRLTFPNSVGGAGPTARSIRREGAYAAWIFLMLFLVSIAIVMLLLSATGTEFEDSLTLAVAALSNTGPLLNVVDERAIQYNEISATARGILCFAMVLGRLEALAIIAILNPTYWRK